MATMYPQWLPTSRKSAAEEKIFNLLRDHLPRNYVVLWSIDWTMPHSSSYGGGAQESEIDFLVLHMEKGILVLEVKGGGVGYDGSLHEWFTINSNKIRHHIKDPFEQAKDGKYALLRELTYQASSLWLREACKKCVFGHAVVVPDIFKERLTNRPTRPDEIVLDRSNLQPNTIQQAIDDVYKLWTRDNAQPLSRPAIDEIIKMYAPSWYIRPPLSAAFENEQIQLKELTEQQFNLLDALRKQKRVAISGCAGSGKTFLAIEQARRLAQRGLSVLITCYNRNLADWLRQRLAEEAADNLSLRSIDVLNFHRLAARLCEQASIQLPTDQSRSYDEIFADGLLEASVVLDQRYDAIIADEGQDFNDTWWIALLSLLQSPDESLFYVFYDDNQRIYGRHSSYPVPADHHYPLSINCRTTQKIHQEVVQYYSAADRPECKGPPGRDIERVSIVPTGGNEARMLYELLRRLTLSEGITLENIVLLSPVGKDKSRFRERTKLGSQFRLSWQIDGPPLRNTLICCTIFAFKGLERDIVILAETDKIQSTAEHEQLIYVAISRAKFHLIILGDLPSL